MLCNIDLSSKKYKKGTTIFMNGNKYDLIDQHKGCNSEHFPLCHGLLSKPT